MEQVVSCDPALDESDEPAWRLGWTLLIAGVFAVLLGPAVIQLVVDPPGPLPFAVLLGATAGLAVLFVRLVTTRGDVVVEPKPPWLELAGFVALAIGLATRGGSWVPALALATLVTALHLPTLPAGVAVLALTGLAGGLGWVGSDDPTTGVIMLLAPAIMGGFGYVNRRATVMAARLHATQQELAGMAVAEERLRIARELHDLLGHSLSLITLKAELAQAVLSNDAERARREIGDVENVARRSLDEVREAVTGYRTPTLAAELVTARRSLATARIACRVDVPDEWTFPEAVDSLLAWSVREGTTNVIRHSHAASCTLRLHVDAEEAAAEIIDDGDGRPDPESPAGSPAGSGLAGLAERAGQLDGRVDTGAAGERGFRLRVRVPLDGRP